jgi:hypothetical protein
VGQEFAARLVDADGAVRPLMHAASLDRTVTPLARAPSSDQNTLERGASLDRPRPSAPSFSAWSPAEHKGEDFGIAPCVCFYVERRGLNRQLVFHVLLWRRIFLFVRCAIHAG